MLRYCITDRERRENLTGVDLVQVRDKTLSARDLLALTRAVLSLVAGTATRVLVNERADVALAAGAHGVHLPANSLHPQALRAIVPAKFLIGLSCHSAAEVRAAAAADFVVLGPIFATPSKAAFGGPLGLRVLHEATHSAAVPVLALGGVTLENAVACTRAGAAGIAGIRIFAGS